MKRLLFLILAALVAGALLFNQIDKGSGYILISLGSTSVEMSFWTGVLLVLLLVGVIWLLRWILVSAVRGVGKGAGSILVRGNRGQRTTAKGLVNFIEGNWKQARKNLLKSANKTDEPLINYLAAARCTYELGNEAEAFDLLHQAENASPDSGLAVALTQARMLLADKKYEQCLANLERAKKIALDHPVVLDLLQQTYVHLEEWKSLKDILPKLKHHHVLTESALASLEQTLYGSSLSAAGEKAHYLPKENARALLKSEWDSIPGHLRKQESLIRIYVAQLQKAGDEKHAEHLLRKTLRHDWHENLVNCYGRIASDDPKKQLLVAEGWLKERPGNAEVMLALGRLSLRNQLWEQAEHYFQSSLRLEKRAETCAELARLFAHLGELEKSAEYYQASLELGSDHLPDLPMPEPFPGESGPETETAASVRAVIK